MKFKNIAKKHYKKKEDKNKERDKIKEKTIFVATPRKTSAKKPFFPNIYRFITESHIAKVKWQKRQFWLNIVSVLAFLGFIVVSAHVYDIYRLSLEVQRTRLSYEEKLAQWEAVNKEFPGFRDGYLQAAVIAYQLGDRQKARNYTQKALNIDPNFNPTRQLAGILGMSEKEELQN